MGEIASGLLSSACQLACIPICQQLNYIRKLKKNEETMQSEWETLECRKKDICGTLETGEKQHGKARKEEVNNWLKNVDEIEKTVNDLRSDGANHMCFKGFCPNYYSRLKRSKKTVKTCSDIEKLRDKGVSFARGENLFTDSPPKHSLPLTTLHGTSAERKKEEILRCIMNPEVCKIGVYGMGGVGKTTIMTQIYNQLRTMDDFEIVIWATVSSSFNLEKLQDNIAKLLGFQLSSSTDLLSRAQELHAAFRRRRNFVIILDDIWKGVSLQNVGIPEPNRNNGSKVVWTTRSLNVCDDMVSDTEIKVEGLTDEEAWSLFKVKVDRGNDIMSTEILPTAKLVAKECGRLPLALITVGCALRRAKDLSNWRHALHQLKISRPDQICGMGEVFGSLKFSYDWLSSDTIRECFLYCALYPEDAYIPVDELIEHWMGEGLINEKGSIQTDKDKGHAYLKELKDACMIERSGDADMYVKMHDLIRDLAIKITRENPEQPLFMVKAGLGLTESPKEGEWVESLQRVSLMNNNIEVFRGQPNCPQLSTLLLHHNHSEVTFPKTFFKHMHNLRVLNLSHTKINSLPNSLSDLVNLQALILKYCRQLKDLPSLAKLQNLQSLILSNCHELKHLPSLAKLQNLQSLILSDCGELKHLPSLAKLQNLQELILSDCGELKHLPSLAKLHKLRRLDLDGLSSLEKLPHGLKNLVKLRRLDISRGKWQGFPSEALLKMPCLEILYMDNNSWRFSTDEEIISLKKLTRFSANFADAKTFNSYIRKVDEFELLKNFDVFQFTVSHMYDGHDVENEIMEKVMLPGTADYLAIDGCNFIQLVDFFGPDELRQLIDCRIQRCNEMEWIGTDREIVLPNLKNLILVKLDSFKGLCKEKAHVETFKSLTHLFIVGCHKLKYLIPIDLLVNNLQNLHDIYIQGCDEMEDVISGKASADKITLPKLAMLYLCDLPRLTSICQGKLVCDSLRNIYLINCAKLKKIPFLINNVSFMHRYIRGSQEWWETLAWEDPQWKERLQPYFESDDNEDHISYSVGTDESIEQMFKIAKLNFEDEKDWFPKDDEDFLERYTLVRTWG